MSPRYAVRRTRPLMAPLAPTFVLAAMLVGGVGANAFAQLRNDSPEVRRAVVQGVRFLEKGDDSRLGAQALAGLACVKAGVSNNHPAIRRAVVAIRGHIDQQGRFRPENAEIYTAGICACFLIALDPDQFRSEIMAILYYLERVQKPHGGWGYLDSETGDTSMTQYGVLATWEALTAGIPVSETSAARVTEWLFRTQDPSGGFGYQGDVSRDGNLVKQDSVRPSLSAAGIGSVYICYDVFGNNGTWSRQDEDLPPALRPVDGEKTRRVKAIRFQPRQDVGRFRATQARGDAWIARNFSKASQCGDNGSYKHYALYAWERYWAFRELAEGGSSSSINWYDSGARYLLQDQKSDGSWQSSCGATADTSFAILFLVRSSRQSIEKLQNLGGGNLIGGRGLPKDSDQVVVRDGQVLSLRELSKVSELSEVLEHAEDPDYENQLRLMGALSADEATSIVSTQGKRLRELAGAESAAARMMAVRTLGKGGDVSQAPTLIYALTDPDRDVTLEARNALRRLSRRIDGFGMPDDFREIDRTTAIEKWKKWYLELDPNAVFER